MMQHPILINRPIVVIDGKARLCRPSEVVLELLDRLVRERGGTMLIATHSARVSSVCDREVEIHGGKLEAASAALESQ